MNKPQKKGVIVSAAQAQISSAYSRAIAVTAEHYQTMTAFVAAQMKKNIDYGTIPGTKKPTLLKPGAEKLCRLFSLRPSYELIHFITDFEKPLFFYHYRCTLVRQGEVVGQSTICRFDSSAGGLPTAIDGSCNSKENKYEKQKYKIYDLTNTIVKMAQKRALVGAVISSCGASAFFTQDMEDMGGAR